MNTPTYHTFDTKEEGRATRWSKWESRLRNVFIGYEIVDPKRRKALLLSFAGDDLNDIVDSLAEGALTPGEGENVYDKLVSALSEFFNPHTNKEFQRYSFRSMKQQTNNIQEFYAELKQAAATCDFDNEEAEIKSQLITGCKMNKVRIKGLSEPDCTLPKLLQYARTLEATELHAKQIESSVNASVNAVHKPSRRYHRKPKEQSAKGKAPTTNQYRKTKECRNCGGNWPHPGGQSKCPAYGKICGKCNKRNHFAKVCRSDQVQAVNSEENQESPPDVGEDFVFSNVQDKHNRSLPLFNVTVGGKCVHVLADSGSTVNLMSETDYHSLRSKPRLTESNTNVFPYGSVKSITLLGSFSSNVQYKDRNCFAMFYVVKGTTRSLLSWETSQHLGMLALCQQVCHKTFGSDILSQYPELFRGVGKLKDVKIKLHIDKDVSPVAQKARRVPFHVRKDIELQLQHDQELGIVETTTGPTPWVSPIVCVPKPKTGKVRVCVDMRNANKAIRRERHCMPSIEELIVELSGAKVFSKLDLNQGYNQLELDEESRYITTFATHLGLRRYTRLFFGINSAAEVFNETIKKTLCGLNGTINISDDILIFGRDQTEHDQNLIETLNRLRDCGLTLNKSKCELNKTSVEYFGHVFNAQGVSASPTKLNTIKSIESPKSASELRSLLGLTNYCGSKFVPDYATLTHDLRQLTHKDVPWHWTDVHEKAIEALKEALCKNVTLNYFSPERATEVHCDASPVGLCAILSQIDENGEKQVVQFASRALSSVESRYSQTEREALAIVYGCEHFHAYLYGAPFTVITDHKPLTAIFGRNATKTQHTPRLERWTMRLQPYDMQVIYEPGRNNPADYLSRHPADSSTDGSNRQEKVTEEYVQYVVERATPKAMTPEEVAEATANDPTLRTVMKAIQSDRWYEERVKANLALNTLYKTLYSCKDELTLAHNNSVILKGNRIVLPESLQQQAVELAHTGHQGITKTLKLLKEKVWFCGMIKLVEDTVKNCMQCQVSTPSTKREPLNMSELPDGPWLELSADFGQVAPGMYILVVQDEYSRYVVVDTLTSLTAKSVIPRFDKIFSEFGLPATVKTDNGPPFNSEEFSKYLHFMGVKHRKITPLWPRANAETERFMRTVKKVIRGKPNNWKQEMNKLLLSYRATPHTTTGIAPATVLFGRDIRTKLPSVTPARQNDDMRAKDTIEKQKMKTHADNKQYVQPSDLKVGDNVLVKNMGVDKSKSAFNSQPLTIVEKKGSMITAQRGEQCITRNSSFFKRSPQPPVSRHAEADDKDDEVRPYTPGEQEMDQAPSVQPDNIPLDKTPYEDTRPKRSVQLPKKFSDFVMN